MSYFSQQVIDELLARPELSVDLNTLRSGTVIDFSLADEFASVRINLFDEKPADFKKSEVVVYADSTDWQRFFSTQPANPYHHLFAMLMRVESAKIIGSELRFAQQIQIINRVLLELRQHITGGIQLDVEADTDDLAGISGKYYSIELATEVVRVYVEEAGSGQPVLLLHTAGSDSRQFLYQLSDSDLTKNYRLIAFDLPGHGKSEQLADYLSGGYTLKTAQYYSIIEAVIAELGLVNPIVYGASMAGLICLELAYGMPKKLGGVIACEASSQVKGRRTLWARHPEVNESLFVPEWVDGLMGPNAPVKHRKEIWWSYSQGGYGTFYGDIEFYSGDWDARDRVAQINTNDCPVVMMTGEYDYSCTTQMSKATSLQIPGATFNVMQGLGHFPHAENPNKFKPYLLNALQQIKNWNRRNN